MTMIPTALRRAFDAVRDIGVRVEPTRWQSTDVSKRVEATTYEVLNHTVRFAVDTEDLGYLRREIGPNLPWADDHFAERVGGLPLNPGVQWAHWPWGNSANSFRSERVPVSPHNPVLLVDGEPVNTVRGFSHTYMERMWPRHANLISPPQEHAGVRYRYGDAADVVAHLAKHPDSRQAYLPIWFPEDTGKTEVRVPCTLGYHFIHRHGYLHCTYYIRSCDLYRHFRDDVYLTVRLQLWVLEQLRLLETAHVATAEPGSWRPFWRDVRPGAFTMHVVSLHCFVNDAAKMWPGWRPR